MKASELKDMSLEELEAYYDERCKELFLLRNEKSESKKAPKPHLVHYARKDIARTLTIMHQRKEKVEV